MHLSFAYVGFVLAASAAATSHHHTRANTVARLNVRSDHDITKNDQLAAKCFGGQGCNGLAAPGAGAVFNQPVLCANGLMPQNQFFSTVQSYTTITTNTANFWSGGASIQTILVQWNILVLSFSTLLAGFQGGCPYQGNSQIVISTFAPLFIQFQTMLTIITQQCGGNFVQFQTSFAAFSVLMQAFIGIAISMQVNIQQFFSACQFNPTVWQQCGFPGSDWLNGQPGGFGGAGFPSSFGGPGGIGGPFGFPSGGPNDAPGYPYDPNGLNGPLGPNGIPISPNGIPISPIDPDGLVPQGGPGIFPGGGGGGAFGFFSGLSSLGKLLLALVNFLEPILHGLTKVVEGLGHLLDHLGSTLGGLLGGDKGLI